MNPAPHPGPDLHPDLLLVAPPLVWGEESRLDMKQPINLLALGSWLNRQGLRALVHDVNSTGTPLPATVERIASLQPRFLGIPFYQATRETALELCRAVRQACPGIWIIAGGPLVTTAPEDLAGCPEIDICVCGEGERTVEELLRSDLPVPRREDSDLSSLAPIPGLVFRRAGVPFATPSRPPIPDLDDLPYLDYTLVDIDWYFRHHASIGMSSWLFLSTSRGCPARCTFCATPVLWPGPMRRQSVPRLLAEIAWQRKRFPQAQFAFMDDTFFSDRRWLNAFFDGIGPLHVRYCCIGRADHLAEETVRRLAETGCVYVALGIETGNPARQKALGKRLDLGRVRASVALLARYGVFCKCFFMLGFPDETPAEMVETINFAVELKRLGMGECNFFPVSIYPGTELAAQTARSAWASAVYRAVPDREGLYGSAPAAGDIGEAKLLRYANIPKGDVNAFFTGAQVLEIVKLAYRRVETAQEVGLSDLPDPGDEKPHFLREGVKV